MCTLEEPSTVGRMPSHSAVRPIMDLVPGLKVAKIMILLLDLAGYKDTARPRFQATESTAEIYREDSRSLELVLVLRGHMGRLPLCHHAAAVPAEHAADRGDVFVQSRTMKVLCLVQARAVSGLFLG